LRQLLPAGKEAAVLAGLLGLLYLLSGIFTRPEAMPHTIGPHLTIWALYALAILLLLANLKNAPVFNTEISLAANRVAWKWIAGFWAAFLFSAGIFTFVKPAAYAAVLLSWVVGIGAGISLLVKAFQAAVRKKGAGL
jgi:hypothetical protein